MASLMISLFDRDRSGTINFEEFKGVWRYINDWTGVFQAYDRGTLGIQRWRKVLVQCWDPIMYSRNHACLSI